MGGSLYNCFGLEFQTKSHLRLCVGLESLHQVADRVVDQVQTALILDIQRRGAGTFLEESPHILHKLVEVEVDADCALKHFQLKLLKEKVVAHTRRDLGLPSYT